MKKQLQFISTIIGFFLMTLISCKKGIDNPITLDKASGKWSINAIRLKIYDGATGTTKDSTVPWRPVVENYVSFDGISNLKYCFNSSSTLNGEYAFIGSDSIRLKIGNDTKRWKVLLLTETNFNIESTSIDKSTLPSKTTITYQGFVR